MSDSTTSSAEKIAFLFPGQGSQTVGMGHELYRKYPEARAVFEEADEALGFAISKLCFEGPDDRLKLTEITQPAILTVSIAALRVLARHGIDAQVAAGHSLGEYSAHVAAGTLSLVDAVRTVHHRGRYMQEAVPPGQGAMAAILSLPADKIIEACAAAAEETGSIVSAANMNSPEQTAISGAAAAVERAAALCKAAGAKRAVMLHVSAPFHCALMQPAQEKLAEDLAHLAFRNPRFPVVSNVCAEFITTGEGARQALIRQVTGAVLWVDSMRLLIEEGVTHFVEVGPGRVLTRLLHQIDHSQTSLHVENEASLEKTLARLKS